MSFVTIVLFMLVLLTTMVGMADLINDLRTDNTPSEFYQLTPLGEFFDDQKFSDELLDELYWDGQYYPPMDWDQFFPEQKTQAEVHVDLKVIYNNHRTVCRNTHRRELRV